MATDLQNESISASYGSLIHLANDNTGLSTTAQILYDGSGDASALRLATDKVHISGSLSATSDVIVAGNVGIGTTTPNKTLTVVGSISAKDEINVRASDGIYLYTAGHTYGYRMRANANDANDYGLYIEKADGTDLMNIRPDGQIAIGHANPLNKFHIDVSGADGNDGILITRDDSTTEDGDLLGGIAFDSTDGNEPSSILQGSAFIAAYAAENHSTGDKGGDLVFGASKIDDNDDTTSHEYMRITSEGWIGIGDTTPDAPFEVAHTKTSSETHSFGGRFHLTDNGQDSTFYGLTIDYDISPDPGWTYSADRTRRGILVDVDSTNPPSTMGSGVGERLYGIDSNVNVTHDPEYLRGCMSNLWIQASAGTIVEASAGYNYLRSIGGNTTTSAYANTNQLLVASGTNTNTYTSYNRTILGSSSYGAGTVANAYGVYSEIEMNTVGSDSALTNGYAYYANLDFNNSLQPSGDSFLYYGVVSHSGGASDNYGIYLTNEDKNYFSGNVGIGTAPSEKLEVAGNILLDADNAKLRLESGATGTTGFVEWGFTSSTIAYASAGIDYDTRASKGFQIGTRNYPMTLQNAGTFTFLNGETSILTVGSNNVTLKNAGAANEGGELRFEPGTNFSEQYNIDSAHNLLRVHSDGTVRCGVSGHRFFVGPRSGSPTYGSLASLFVSAGEAEGHGPNVLAETDFNGNLGFTAMNINTWDNEASNRIVNAGSYLQALSLSGAAVIYTRSDSTLNASRGNTGELGRWVIGQLSNSGPNYDGTGSAEASLGRTWVLHHQFSTDGGTTYSNGKAWKWTDSGHFLPGSDDTQDLGLSNHRWDDIYATNSTIQTSDRTLKENISASTLGLDFIKDLNPVSYKWKDYSTTETIQREYGDLMAPNTPLSAETVTEDKTFSRTHYGLIAQEVKTALDTANVPTSAFAGYIDPSVGGGEGNLGLRYSEFIAPMIKAIQEQQTIIESLSTKLYSVSATVESAPWEG